MNLISWIIKKLWRRDSSPYPFTLLFSKFQEILSSNNKVLEMMADMAEKLGGDYVFDRRYIETSSEEISDLVLKMVRDLNILSDQKYVRLYETFDRIHEQIIAELEGRRQIREFPYTFSFDEVSRDLVEAVGNKTANLCEVRNVLKLLTPDGFAISTKAFHDFLAYNHLIGFIEEHLTAIDSGKVEEQLKDISVRITQRILEAEIPSSLRREILGRVEELKRRFRTHELFFAVRSSAWGEDTESAFAGQYRSFLNVPEAELLTAYKRVIASTYELPVLRYRLLKDYKEHEIAMAVSCQVMVNPQSSGVLYTLDPSNPELEQAVVGSTWGLGLPIVGGEIRGDHYLVNRNPPYEVIRLQVVNKTEMLVPKPEGGVHWITVPEEKQDKPSPGGSYLQEIVQTGLIIERYYKRPQDIEWCVDRRGNLVILQARPLKIAPFAKERIAKISEIMSSAPVVFANRGVVVQRGVAAGPVFVLRSEEDFQRFPQGAILVSRQTSPRFAQLIRKAQGIITDIGSPTGHLAAVAREFRVPTIVNTGIATLKLKTGDQITLDATENIVYRGSIRELQYYELIEEEVFEESYEYRLLSRILKKISPLNLVDPHSPDFDPACCKTYHDITRFVHEKAVEELICLSSSPRSGPDVSPKHLKLSVPLGLTVIDSDGGLSIRANSKNIYPEDIRSLPMRAFLEGLTESKMWATEPVSLDIRSFMSSMTRTFSSAMAGPEHVGRNLAVISRNYMSLNLRLGYHFNIIDAYISEDINDNLIYFRFLGGVTDEIRRSRRARFLLETLERFDFRVELRGDLVIGRAKKLPMPLMLERMKLLGAIVAYTRQLDVQLDSEEKITLYLNDFLSRLKVLVEVS